MGGLLAGGIGLLSGCAPKIDPPAPVAFAGIQWVPLPSPGATAARWMSLTEITLGQWADFLADTGHAWPGNGRLTRDAAGAWRIQPGHDRLPATHVNRADAEAYCAWLSGRGGGAYRLPSDTEWEAAARGGLEGTRFPWGWEPARGRAVFDTDGAQAADTGPANRLGLRGMAGNVWEWVATADGRGEARGGAWAEREERLLECGHRQPFPPEYRDADVGFRVLREAAGTRAGYSAMPIQKVALK